MKLAEFRKFVINIGKYYGLNKTVDNMRLEMWYDEIQNIPAESLPFITKKIFSEKESMPRNIPMYVKLYFKDWLATNKDKYQPHTKTVCNECNGDGLIYYIDKTGQYPVNRVARCPFCENWKSILGWEAVKNYPVRTKKDLMESGYTLQYGG